MCNVISIFVQGHMSAMCNVFITMLLVTLFIALSSYKVYILTFFCVIYTHKEIGLCDI